MDHEVVMRPCRIRDWLLNLSRNHFSLHQGKNVRVTMEFQVPKRHISLPTISTNMVQHVLRWEWQKRCSSSSWQRYDLINFLMSFFWGNVKTKTRGWSNFIYLYIEISICKHEKNQRVHFLVHDHFLLVHIWLTPSEGPKDFVD